MATQVILLEPNNLGGIGDIVSVKPGYARNYLLPQKKALRANKENIAYFEARKKHFETENEKRRKDAEKQSTAVRDLTVVLVRQASETGQLYGSVNGRDIAQSVSEASGQEIDRRMVQLNQNFKMIGLFPVEVLLHPEVKVGITVNIARSVEEAEIQKETGKAVIAQDQMEDENAQAGDAEADAGLVPEQLEEVLEDSALEAEKQKALEDAEETAETGQTEKDPPADAQA